MDEAPSAPPFVRGASGAHGWLRLEVARRDSDGRTVRVGGGHGAPLHLARLMYPEPTAHDMAYAYMSTLGGGLVPGDHLGIDIVALPHARLHVTTTGATRLHRGTDTKGTGHRLIVARQRVRLEAFPWSLLEWWPDVTIPYRGSAYRGDIEIVVHPEAAVLCADVVLPGRTWGHEWHHADAYATRTVVRRPDGTIMAVDAQVLAPAPAGARPFGATIDPLRGTVIGILALVPVSRCDEAVASLREVIAAQADGFARAAGVSVLPNGAGVGVRAMASGGQEARAFLDAAWKALRNALGGPVPPSIPKS